VYVTLTLNTQATSRGYNILSLDTDMRISLHPLRMMRSPTLAPFKLLLQLDSGWPVEGGAEGQHSTDARGQHENTVRYLEDTESITKP